MDLSGPHLLPAEPAEDFPGETFRVLKNKEVKEFGEYRTRRLVVDAWERMEQAEGDRIMIWESYPWKEELHRIVDRLERKSKQRRWTDRTDANLEKDVFVGCYAIRKLIEARKLTECVLSHRVACTLAPLRPGRRVTLQNWHKLGELHDLDRERPDELAVKDLCNQFIHSYVFCAVFGGESGLLESVAVASDWKRREYVHLVRVSDLIQLFRAVGDDDATESHAVWDDSLGDYRVTLR